MSTYGLVVQKKEMTRMWVNDKFASVTLLTVPTQEIVRYKTEEKDGYVAAVVGVGKKETGKVKGAKIAYKQCAEFPVDANFIQQYTAGTALTSAILEGVEKVTLIGEGKGKGFQWVMKRHNAHGWQKTRGSKFHRWVGSTGNRKPRRTQKGHPHAGRMGGETVKLKDKQIIDMFTNNGEYIVAVKGSVPGSYNGILKLYVS